LLKFVDNKKHSFPGVLWLLPIFFGPFGGIIAALVSSMKYNASWWELLVVGLFMPVVYLALGYFIGLLIIS